MKTKPRTVVIMQARIGSTRLPSKVLKKIDGKTLLEYEIERLKDVKLADAVCVATTTEPEAQAIVEICDRMGVSSYRGSTDDVLARYYEAALLMKAELIIRVTADCPVIDPEVIDQMIEAFVQENAVDYVSNTQERTYPRGLDAEIFSFAVLKEAHEKAKTSIEREHVTPYIYRNTERFKIRQVTNSQDLSSYRWTVDTAEDFSLIEHIIGALYMVKPQFRLKDILKVIGQNPSWPKINAHIEQKKV